jgi:hypothetical protein
MITARRRVPVKTTALAAMTAKKDLAQGQALLLSTWDAARRALEVGAIPTGNDLKAIGENGGAYTLRRKRITLPDNPKNRIKLVLKILAPLTSRKVGTTIPTALPNLLFSRGRWA